MKRKYFGVDKDTLFEVLMILGLIEKDFKLYICNPIFRVVNKKLICEAYAPFKKIASEPIATIELGSASSKELKPFFDIDYFKEVAYVELNGESKLFIGLSPYKKVALSRALGQVADLYLGYKQIKSKEDLEILISKAMQSDRQALSVIQYLNGDLPSLPTI